MIAMVPMLSSLLLQAPGLPLGGSQAAGEMPLSPEMRAVDVDERRGTTLDGNLRFSAHDGSEVAFSELFDGRRPVLLTLNYFRCKVVCNVQLQGLTEALGKVGWDGTQFRVVTVSIDPREKPADAASKRETLLSQIEGPALDWSLLTGTALSIQALAAQVGISFAYDAEQDQYAHPAVAVFLSPEGKLVQYVYGLAYDPLDLKLGLSEAAAGKVGSAVEKLVMSCFHYDATIGRYGPFAMGIMRIGGGLAVFVLSTVLWVLWRRERRTPAGRSAEALS